MKTNDRAMSPLLDCAAPSDQLESAKTFRYLRDPLFLACLAIYFINRLLLKPYLPNTFSQYYLNDVICLPFWIPIMLFAMRRLGLRCDDAPPRASEVLVPLVVWSYAFEVVAPNSDRFQGLAIGDHRDIACYALGALIAAVVWRGRPLNNKGAPHEAERPDMI